MRSIVKLSSAQHCYTPRDYHPKLKGAIWDALPERIVERYHDRRDGPKFVFSNVFPPGEMHEGDTRHVMVASPHDEIIHAFEDGLDSGDEFLVGEMAFQVEHVSSFGTDVGEPGETGTLVTETGVYVRLPQWKHEELGIDTEYDADVIGWSLEDHSLGAFLTQVRQNLAFKHDAVFPEYLESPSEETELFTSMNPTDNYALDLAVTSRPDTHIHTFVVSKWELDYHVRNDDHRRWLNLLLDSGMGWRNSLGLGFVNREGA